MSNYKILLFYKYVQLKSPDVIVKEQLDWCLQNDIKGRVFFAFEGVNGTVSGLNENIENYKSQLTNYPEFKDMWFKEDDSD